MTSSCYYRQLQAIVENVFVFSAISALDVLRQCVVQIYILLNLLTYLLSVRHFMHTIDLVFGIFNEESEYCCSQIGSVLVRHMRYTFGKK